MAPDESNAALRYVASAISGRTLDVERIAAGSVSYCDGRTIFVDPALLPEHARVVTVLHALLVAAGSLDFETTKTMRPQSAEMSRFLALEAARIASSGAFLVPRSFRPVLALTLSNPASISRADSLRVARDGRLQVTPLESWCGTIDPARLSRGSTPDLLAEGVSAGEGGTRDSGDSESGQADKFLNFLSSPFNSGSYLGDLMAKILGGGRSGARQAEGNAASADSWSPAEAATTGARKVVSSAAPNGRGSSGDVGVNVAAVPFLYREWSESRGEYRNNWAHVHELRPGMPQRSQPVEPCRLDRRQMERQLFRVGAEHEMHNREFEGDDLDMDQVLNFVVETRLGNAGDENLYRKSRRTKRDLSVLVLMDISRSTAENAVYGGSVFGQQREVARLLAETFSRFGDQVGLYAFHSMGRKLVRFLKIKGFDERFGAETSRMLDRLEPGGLTRLGAAIRHSAHILLSQKRNTHRLIITLSDGFAYDEGYEGMDAEFDTARALQEARQAGVACVCVTIGGSSSDATCARAFGKSAYLLCPRASDLPGRLRPLLMSAISAASTSQSARIQQVRHGFVKAHSSVQ